MPRRITPPRLAGLVSGHHTSGTKCPEQYKCIKIQKSIPSATTFLIASTFTTGEFGANTVIDAAFLDRETRRKFGRLQKLQCEEQGHSSAV
uniref:Uncharacterized protein n=1 Tax=Ditylenchus dipsaci TaxID=166011 RepID=A0A915DSP6_9BILA